MHRHSKNIATSCGLISLFVIGFIILGAMLGSKTSHINFTTSGKLTCLHEANNINSDCVISIMTDNGELYSLKNYPSNYVQMIGSRVQVSGLLEQGSSPSNGTITINN